MTAEELAARFEGARKTSGGYLVRCPAHEDRSPSLSICDSRDGRVLLHCFAGCAFADIVGALHLDPADYSPGEHVAMRDADASLALDPAVRGETVEHVRGGLTLEGIAEAKRLPVEFLKQLGCRSAYRNGVGAVSIPYVDEDGVVVAMRFRLSVAEALRFQWRRGDKVHLYGADRLQDARRAGWALLVEGESDCWTAWYHCIPCIGVPGKSTWRGARGHEWAAKLAGLQIYLWQEPDADDLTAAVGKDLPRLRVIVAPDGVKDVSEAHLAGHDLASYLEALKAKAVTFAELSGTRHDTRLAELERRAAEVLRAADPLELVRQSVIDSGYGGDTQPAIVTYLALTSRVLAMRRGAMPVHLLLVGPPAAGKSYTLRACLNLLPGEAYHTIDAGSPRVLIYDDANLVHRAVIFGEADSLPAGEDNPAASAVRNLLQDHELHYSVAVRDTDGGRFVTQEVHKPGPSVLVTTAVRRLGAQLDSRLFILDVPDDQTQIANALRAQAALETNPAAPEAPESLIAFQGYLQERAPWEVVVPFAGELADAIANQPNDARVVRDYARLLSLVKSAAVVRHTWRARDEAGRVVATLDDYATVHALVADVYRASSTGAGTKVRAVVEAVAEIRASRPHATVTQVQQRLSLSKSAASRHVTAALKAGWLTNDESRKGYPSRLKVGEALPPEAGLPSPDALAYSAASGGDTESGTLRPSLPRPRCSTVPSLTADGSAGSSLTAADQDCGQEDPCNDSREIPSIPANLFGRAVEAVAVVGVASVPLIAARCDCSDDLAVATMVALEAAAVVGPSNGHVARDVLISEADVERIVTDYATRFGDGRDVDGPDRLPKPGEPEWTLADGVDLL